MEVREFVTVVAVTTTAAADEGSTIVGHEQLADLGRQGLEVKRCLNVECLEVQGLSAVKLESDEPIVDGRFRLRVIKFCSQHLLQT